MPCQRLSTVMDLYRQRPPRTMRMLSSVENLRRIPESHRFCNGRLTEDFLNVAHAAQQDARGAINNAAALTPRYSMCDNGWEGLLGHAGIQCLLRPKRGSC
jgi:hypothetical protein